LHKQDKKMPLKTRHLEPSIRQGVGRSWPLC